MEIRICTNCHAGHGVLFREGISHQFRLPCLKCGKEFETGLNASEVFRILLIQQTQGRGAPERTFDPPLKPID